MDLRRMQSTAVETLMSTALIRELQHGKATREQYRAYMVDVYCYALHSSQVIGEAASRLVLREPALAQYLFAHASEELGHDRWAASDLRELGVEDRELGSLAPSSPCLRMIALEYFYATQANPVGLFGWMLALESLGGRVAGGLAELIDSTMQLGGKATRFLRGHGKADAQHSVDLYQTITEHITAHDDLAGLQIVFQESVDLYCAILEAAFIARGASQQPVAGARY
jgi:pyrroloquinoline quinone (PQQ) biosynthesis protein C